MAPFAGYCMPVRYSAILEEHIWTRSHASLFDVSHMGQLVLSGADAAASLARIIPANPAGLRDGQMRYSLLLNDSGGIIDDLMVSRMGDDFALVVNASRKHADLGHLRHHLPAAVTLEEQTELAMLALQGPEAAQVLSAILPGTERLDFMSAARLSWNGGTVWVSRSGYTGEDGFELSLPATMARALADRMVADERVRPAGLGARDTLRLEAGLPLHGQDLSEEIDPISAGLRFAISPARLASGGWIGHAAIARIVAGGPVRMRAGLILEGRVPARTGSLVMAGEEVIGAITSGSYSPSLERPVAMALLSTPHTRPGTGLTVCVRNHRLDAEVVPLPFIPHRYHRTGARR